MWKRVKFYLKSGQVVAFKAKTCKVIRNTETSEIVRIDWSGADRIVVATVNDISAVEVL